jgi:hypothetical protein
LSGSINDSRHSDQTPAGSGSKLHRQLFLD